MEKEMEILRLKLEVVQGKAQTFEQLVSVAEYKKLLIEANEYMMLIAKMEEGVRRNEMDTNPNVSDPILGPAGPR